MELNDSFLGIEIRDKDKMFEIYKTRDQDVWFVSEYPNVTFEFDGDSENKVEYQLSQMLMTIIGKIIENYSVNSTLGKNLPDDFIDLNRKKITLHSDGYNDNKLELLLSKDKKVVLSIIKDSKASINHNNAVRIRANGSKYQDYYKLFKEFYKLLDQFRHILKEQKDNISLQQK